MRWLLIDSTYLCHRAWHSTGNLVNDGMGTGVAFGVLRDIQSLVGKLVATRIVFAFDHPSFGLRSKMNATYKGTRTAKKAAATEEEKEGYDEFDRQVAQLRDDLLPRLGYRNVIQVRGYEADDIIAMAAQQLPEGDSAVIITADGDMLQCLDDNVSMHNPLSGKTTTLNSFRQEWGIDPIQWASVKAIAGCKSDDVEGLKGIGEITVIKWMTGKLTKGKKYELLQMEGMAAHSQNLPLVKLPFPGLKLPQFKADEDMQAWTEVMAELGIRKKRAAPRTRNKGFDI